MDFTYEQMRIIYIKLIEGLSLILLGMVIYRYSILNKINENKIIKKQALTDPLTGKANRNKFLIDMQNLLKIKKKFAVCFMDLDGFKHINDTLGHDMGDLLLQELGRLLDKNLPKNALSYRLGGDEFSIVITNINTIDEISLILNRLKTGLKTPIKLGNTMIVLEYSLGVSIYPTDGTTTNELIAYADDAMYYIKENGKNDYYFHNEALRSKQDNKKKMETDLKKALINSEFDIEFQPRVNIKDLNEICFEILMFWNHPVLGKLNSEYFNKQAEEMGIITDIDLFVIKKACDKLKLLREKGYKNIKFSVNISNQHAKRHDFVDALVKKISEYNFNIGELQFEFTNSISVKFISNYKYIIDKLESIGVGICISDLKIKYENLKLFKTLHIDEIKVSTGYISTNSIFKKKLLKDIIDVANDLEYTSVITQIETKEELKYSILANVCKVQGNYLFEKININNLEEFLINYPSFKKGLDKIIKACRGDKN
ncbi:MAG: EAL domain-containing protein [Clostridia bacterium]